MTNHDFRDESFGAYASDPMEDEIDTALVEARAALMVADAALGRVERRLLSPGEVARFHALRPRACPRCFQIRMGHTMFRDGACLWCWNSVQPGTMNPDVERRLLEDREFLRTAQRRFTESREGGNLRRVNHG